MVRMMNGKSDGKETKFSRRVNGCASNLSLDS